MNNNYNCGLACDRAKCSNACVRPLAHYKNVDGTLLKRRNRNFTCRCAVHENEVQYKRSGRRGGLGIQSISTTLDWFEAPMSELHRLRKDNDDARLLILEIGERVLRLLKR